MNIVATIEARMTSSRLPGKVLLPVLGKPLLGHMIDRVRKVPSVHQIVLATTTNASDDILVEFAKRYEISCFRGSEDDVMGRVIGAAESVKADIVVELTGDCPLIDAGLIEQTLQLFFTSSADYVSNCHVRNYPDGMDTQVYKLVTLKKSAALTQEPLDREHVTRHIIQNPKLFSQEVLPAPPNLKFPEMCVTLDEPADYELIAKIFEYFKEKPATFTCQDVVTLLRETHPEWLQINKDVKRKGLNQ